MLDINHILVVLDSEHPEQIALTKAIWLAKKVEADLTLLSSVYEPYATEHSALDLETREKLHAAKTRGAEEWINSFVSEATEAGVRAVTRVIWAEHLEDAVTELLNQQDFDLVIKGTRHHSMMDHLFSHEDWELMNQTDAPVMLVKTAQPWQSNRILASVDATAVDAEHRRINENILEYAEHLSDHFETDLHLVNAYPQIALALAMVPEVTTPSDIQETI
ncbi:MAG: universal stress protein, partial [Oceanobacter sp.]